MTEVTYSDLGLVDYGAAWDFQEQKMQEALAIKKERFGKDTPQEATSIHNHLYLVTHPHVYTLGKSGLMEHLLVSNQRLKDLGATFYKTNRGGDITYHGPGQLVAYPILDLEQFHTDLGWYMRSLEEAVILTIARYGITAGRSKGETGVWLDPDDPVKARKICAMGVKCSRWVTMHGLALNMNTHMEFFHNIIPCGIVDKGVTSMEMELGHKVDEAAVKKDFLECFAEVFQVALKPELNFQLAMDEKE